PAGRARERRQPLRRRDRALQAREAAGENRGARLGAREPGSHRRPDRRAGAAVPARNRRDGVEHGGIARPWSPGARPPAGSRELGLGGTAGPKAAHPVPEAPPGPGLKSGRMVIWLTIRRVDAFLTKPYF